MEDGRGASVVFKPRYSAGHWVQPISIPVIVLLPFAINWLAGRLAGWQGLAASLEGLVAYGLIALLWALEVLSFLASDHIRSIRVGEGSIELFRPLGRSIRAEFSQASWLVDRLQLGRHIYGMLRVRNSGELVKLLPPNMFLEKQQEQGWFRRLKASRWLNAAILLAVLAISGAILAWWALRNSGWPEFLNLWALDGLLALVACALLVRLIRKLV